MLTDSLGIAEDVMRSYAPPDDVGLSGANTLAVLKRSPTIGCPTYLEDASVPRDTTNPQSLSGWTSRLEIGDELLDHGVERPSLLGRQLVEFSRECVEPVKCRQCRAASLAGPKETPRR